MLRLDWIFVVFGAVVAAMGGWIQLHPERVVPCEPGQNGRGQAGRSGAGQSGVWQIDRAARVQIRALGACFLFMGVFFALQMTVDLIGRPWWVGALSGLASSIAAVTLVYSRVRRQHRGRHIIQRTPLAGKVLELR